jgi:hypothetical protein
MPIRWRDCDMDSSDDEHGDFFAEMRTDNCFVHNAEVNKRSCAVLLPQASAYSPSDYAACLLALPGCHDSSVNQSRLNKCMLLGMPPQLIHWLAVEFGSDLLCLTLVGSALNREPNTF